MSESKVSNLTSETKASTFSSFSASHFLYVFQPCLLHAICFEADSSNNGFSHAIHFSLLKLHWSIIYLHYFANFCCKAKWYSYINIYILFIFFYIMVYHKILKVPCAIQPEKVMAPHSSTLAWKIPWMEEPRRLQSTGLLRVGPDWATSLSLFSFMHWRRKRQPTPVFLPGESQGRGSLVGCHLWGHTESDMTEVT